MLPILALLVASSTLASAGIVRIDQVSSNDLSRTDNSLVSRFLGTFDNGDINANELYLGTILKDLSRQGGNQAFANGQALAILGEISSDRAGDACAAANYINAYTRYVATGKSAGVREALRNYIQVLIRGIDNIVGLATNKESIRFKSGNKGKCSGEGRTYQFEQAWDIILGQNQNKFVDEEYCVAKRLYCGFTALSNNFGAQATASALPLTVQVFELSSRPLTDFMQRVGAKSKVAQSAASLKQALSAAVGRVSL